MTQVGSMHATARLIAPLVLVVQAASAEVTDSSAHGFTTTHAVTLEADRIAAWRAAVFEVGQWWSSDHTITGNASRLSIDAVPQGCFCEALGGSAGVVHMTVTFVNPGVLLRLTGGLGPLGLMGVNGNMTWEFDDAEDGTRVTFTYAVGGYRPGGLDEIATSVDAVIGDALDRLKRHVEFGGADGID